MKFTAAALLILTVGFAAAATIPESAAPETSPNVPAVDVLTGGLEERAQCSGERKKSDVCEGKFLKKRNSGHNWYDCHLHLML